MRTVLLANNRLGERVAEFLKERGDLLGLVLHAPARRRAFIEPERFGVPTWTWPDGIDAVRELAPEALVSVLFGHLVPSEWLSVPTWRAVNLHPGLLPHNAGAAPNVWPLVDGSPAGTTLHEMVPALDAGGIIAQLEVPVRADDTAARLYDRLENASFALLSDVWDDIADREPVPQEGPGSCHRLADLAGLDPTPEEIGLIDRLRARTFPPYGAEYEIDGRRYRVRVEIEPVEDA